MSDTPLTCPYCNAFIQTPPASGEDRLLCPRCGELFTPPPGSYAGQSTEQGPTFAAIAGDTPLSPHPKPRGRNRLVAALLLLVMAAMAGTGLILALQTTGLRREHDTGATQSRRQLPFPTDAATLSATGPVAPAKLDALAWLPPDTSLILGVHLAEIGDSSAGQARIGATDFRRQLRGQDRRPPALDGR